MRRWLRLGDGDVVFEVRVIPLVAKLLCRIPHRVVTDECNAQLGPLFIRYFLTPRGLPVCLYLHEFRRSDNDRCFHDHPWNFLTLIVRGGYVEHMPTGNFWRRPGRILWRRAEHRHWVELAPGTVSWTLVLRFRRRRVWGFWTKGGFVPWNSYDCRE